MNAKLKEPEAITYWAQVDAPKNNNGETIVAEINNVNNHNTFMTINSTVEMKPGESLLLVKKADINISNITKLRDYNTVDTAQKSLRGGWIAMLKKQIQFMLISSVTILLSLAGFIFFLITKSTIIYPTIYLVTFVAGLGWLLTAAKGLSDVLKRG